MVRTLAAFAVLLAAALAVHAQDWPARTLTMIVPFPAGGPLDVVARILAPPIGELLGQQIIIENVAGAGGSTGSSRVAKAVPDGYIFLYGNSGTHTYSQLLSKRPPYNAVTDFAPVAVFVENSKVLVARKDLPADTLPEFIAYAKANQSRMQYGSAGAGSATHVTCVLLNVALGLEITHVPYRGTGPAMQDLMGGRIDYVCDVISTALPLIRSRSVKPIALLSPQRSRVLPDLATAQEQGLAGFDADAWNAFFLPEGHARIDRAPARQGDQRRARHDLGARADRRTRPQRSAAAAAHPRVLGQARSQRARKMGRAGEGERGEHRLTHSASSPDGRSAQR